MQKWNYWILTKHLFITFTIWFFEKIYSHFAKWMPSKYFVYHSVFWKSFLPNHVFLLVWCLYMNFLVRQGFVVFQYFKQFFKMSTSILSSLLWVLLSYFLPFACFQFSETNGSSCLFVRLFSFLLSRCSLLLFPF